MIVPVIQTPTIAYIEPSIIGADRRLTFCDFVWDERNEFLDFKILCEYGRLHTEVVEDPEEEIKTWEKYEDEAFGLKSFSRSFRADNRTIVVRTTGEIVKYSDQDATVDLDDPNIEYVGQFDFYYEQMRKGPIDVMLLKQSFIHSVTAQNLIGDVK